MPAQDDVRVRVLGNFRDALLVSVLSVGTVVALIAGAAADAAGLAAWAPLVVAAAALIPPRFAYRWWRRKDDARFRELHRRLVTLLTAPPGPDRAGPDDGSPSSR